MNIFNRSYFDDGAIARGAQAARNSLRAGGIWIGDKPVRPDYSRLRVCRYSETPGTAYN